ncbi:MAG: peptidoglycan DD-metalloendopeptidase family protein [Eubacterium sp.]|nr:peptidoglycan DD-metalloendopeptidase family protein [Eubacterium sp.]
MKQFSAKKLICLVLSILFAFSSFEIIAWADEETASEPVTAEETTAAEETTVDPEAQKAETEEALKEQRKTLNAQLKDNEKKLKEYKDNAKTTAEYIDLLDEKIGILDKELKVLDKEVTQARAKVEELNKQIEPLEEQLKVLQEAYDEAQKEFEKLQDDFDATYNAYCLRLRAMYISGSDSLLSALLSSKDLAQFFSRYEMIKAVSKSDTELLKEVNSKMEKIITKQDGLNERKEVLTAAQTELNKKRDECKKEQEKVEKNQELMAQKKVILADDRAESDRLFAIYTQSAAMYTEFRNEDEEISRKVNAEIDALLSGLKSPDEVTTANINDHADDKEKMEQEMRSLYSGTDAVLSMTYPAPGHYGVSQYFGHYRNGRAHTGIDYPLSVGSKVVAAQKGVVVKVRRLNYSYGYYVMIYHGTDAKGRKIVTLYAHNSSILVSVGQSVVKGQQIAKGGSTGNSTGPHCHFEVIINGSKVNPAPFLSK